MLCYANSIILSPGQNHVDLMAYDDNKSHDVVYNILANSKTNVEMILTTPDSEAMKEAIKSKKLGNDAKENREQEIFYEARDNVKDPESIFVKAARENRFKLYYTNISLPYALFITEYEDGYEFLDNIKVDLYSPYIGSSVRRRTFYVFREDTENFEFFLRNYEDIKSHTENTKREDLL